LDSLARNAPPDAEIILVDDASPLRRETEQAVSRFEKGRRVRLVRNEKNLGYPSACNVGLRLATEPYLLLTNTDVRIPRGAVDSLVSVLAERPEVGIVAPVTNNACGFTAQQVNGFPGIESYSEPEFEKIERYAADVRRALQGFW